MKPAKTDTTENFTEKNAKREILIVHVVRTMRWLQWNGNTWVMPFADLWPPTFDHSQRDGLLDFFLRSVSFAISRIGSSVCLSHSQGGSTIALSRNLFIASSRSCRSSAWYESSRKYWKKSVSGHRFNGVKYKFVEEVQHKLL